MNAELKDRFFIALMAQMQALEAEVQVLAAESRVDESHHKKAARNIYGIYAQLLSGVRDEAAYERFFETIPENWYAARALAAEHGDHERIVVEDAKLTAVREIIAMYRACKEEVSHD